MWQWVPQRKGMAAWKPKNWKPREHSNTLNQTFHSPWMSFFHIARRCLQGGSILVGFSSLVSPASGFREGELQGQRKSMTSFVIIMLYKCCSQRTRTTCLVGCPVTFSLNGSISHKTHWLRCQEYHGDTLSNMQSLSSGARQINKPQTLSQESATTLYIPGSWHIIVPPANDTSVRGNPELRSKQGGRLDTCTKIGFDCLCRLLLCCWKVTWLDSHPQCEPSAIHLPCWWTNRVIF